MEIELIIITISPQVKGFYHRRSRMVNMWFLGSGMRRRRRREIQENHLQHVVHQFHQTLQTFLHVYNWLHPVSPSPPDISISL